VGALALGTAGITGALGFGLLGGSASAQSTVTPSTAASTATTAPKAAKGGLGALTDAQKACLTSKGVTLPTPGQRGPGRGGRAGSGTTASTPTTKAATTATTKPAASAGTSRAALDAAAKACGITVPVGGHGHDGGRGPGGPGKGLVLTDAQKTCLASKGFTVGAPTASTTPTTKPASGTTDRRAAFDAAAKACGITLPAGGPGHDGGGRRGAGTGGTGTSGSSTATAKSTVRA
jgi:hypothetical protein